MDKRKTPSHIKLTASMPHGTGFVEIKITFVCLAANEQKQLS